MGKRIRPDFLSQHFPDFLITHQMKRIRFHDLRQSALCQWREPEGNSGVAGAQRYQRYKQHLYTFGFVQQGIFCQCPRQDLPGGDKSVKMSRMRGIKIAKDPQLKLRVLRYAGGGGLPRTEQQPAGLIAPLLCRVVLFDPLTRRR